MNKLLIVFILVFGLNFLYAQQGDAFLFLNTDISPRSAALGGNSIAIIDGDLSIASTNPSALAYDTHNKLYISFSDYFNDINIVNMSYAYEIKDFSTLCIGVKAIDYGFFDQYDIYGNTNGSFNANEQIFHFGLGKRLNKYFLLGLNINLLNSKIENYNSLVIGSDLSATYFYNSRFSSTLLMKNIGKQIDSFTSSKEELPFEIQLAISNKLLHLPFRYHIAYEYLNLYNIKSPYKLMEQTNPETGALEIREESIAKTFLRHIVIGGELNPFNKSLFLRGGFNFQRRFNMTIKEKLGYVGFSWGIGFAVHKFKFDFSRSINHYSGTPNNFSISTNLTNFVIK